MLIDSVAGGGTCWC